MNRPKQLRCHECEAGEHDNKDDRIRLVTVKNPDGGRVRNMYLCEAHREIMIEDGYHLSGE